MTSNSLNNWLVKSIMAPSTSLDSSSALSESITSHYTNTKTSSSESHVTITETTTTTTTSRDFSSSIESTQNSFIKSLYDYDRKA
ncbi:unnamed protein product [Macrosiphum euphorbiae]|uniref:Uncharacterized protein n=1 Tax=Macrosiphum euphorbiae TaxID=13131 RepID=A0AAV0XHX9_9HEMI|nr:unnamed protein product [Macrosiphum euphorbiae]